MRPNAPLPGQSLARVCGFLQLTVQACMYTCTRHVSVVGGLKRMHRVDSVKDHAPFGGLWPATSNTVALLHGLAFTCTPLRLLHAACMQQRVVAIAPQAHAYSHHGDQQSARPRGCMATLHTCTGRGRVALKGKEGKPLSCACCLRSRLARPAWSCNWQAGHRTGQAADWLVDAHRSRVWSLCAVFLHPRCAAALSGCISLSGYISCV